MAALSGGITISIPVVAVVACALLTDRTLKQTFDKDGNNKFTPQRSVAGFPYFFISIRICSGRSASDIMSSISDMLPIL